MSYGVTKLWASRTGRARAAGKRKGKSTKTAKRSKARSAPRAKKRKSRAPRAVKPSAKRRAAKPRKAKKPKAAKLYKRYDPVTGELAKVTADDPRYDDWRKTRGTVASRKKALLKADPLEYAKTFGLKAASTRAERAAASVASRAARKVAPIAGGGLASVGSTLLKFAPLAGLTAAAIGAVLLQNKSVSDARLALGEKINALSRAFVAAQAQLAKEYRVPSFGHVPEEARTRLLNGYKAALAAAQKATIVPQSGKFGQFGYHTTGR
jgi:hypothetical protein